MRRVAVLGASGLVGACLRRDWAETSEVLAPSHAELDVLDAAALADFVESVPSQTVVNCIAWANVDSAEAERGDTGGLVHRLNVDYPRRLAALCAAHHKQLVHLSTDYVFDGTKATAAYVEDDAPHAVCWYAETKLRGEQAVLESDPAACVARIEMPFTGRDHPKRDLARTLVERLRQGQTFQGVTDQRITPLLLDDAAHALGRLIDAGCSGIVHVASADWTTPFAFARLLAARLALPEDLILAESFENFSRARPAPRPQHSWLDVSHYTRLFGTGILRSVEEEVDAFARVPERSVP